MDYLLMAIDPTGQTGIYLSSYAQVQPYKDKGWHVWKIYSDGRKEEI